MDRQECPEGSVWNPKTGRAVKVGGQVWKSLVRSGAIECPAGVDAADIAQAGHEHLRGVPPARPGYYLQKMPSGVIVENRLPRRVKAVSIAARTAADIAGIEPTDENLAIIERRMADLETASKPVKARGPLGSNPARRRVVDDPQGVTAQPAPPQVAAKRAPPKKKPAKIPSPVYSSDSDGSNSGTEVSDTSDTEAEPLPPTRAVRGGLGRRR